MTQVTVRDLQDSTFNTVWFKGYEAQAVDRLLDDVTETLTQKEREIAVLQDKLAVSESRITAYEDMERSISKSVIVAQDTSEKVTRFTEETARATLEHADKESQLMLDKAKVDADDIIQKAKNEAARLIQEAKSEAHTITTDALSEERMINKRIQDMITNGEYIRNSLKSAVASHLDLIENDAIWAAFPGNRKTKDADNIDVADTQVMPILSSEILDRVGDFKV